MPAAQSFIQFLWTFLAKLFNFLTRYFSYIKNNLFSKKTAKHIGNTEFCLKKFIYIP
jgi:hypothetical protein